MRRSVTMLSPALLTTIACWLAVVWCEWVEISQHHYRPRRPQPQTHYFNTTIHEHNWNLSPSKHIDIKTVDNTGHNNRLSEVTSTFNIRQNLDSFEDRTATEIPKLHVQETGIKGKVEKVPNVGNVKRVQLSNTPIKSPTIKITNYPIRRLGNEDTDRSNTPLPSEYSDEFDIKSDIFKDSYEEVVSAAPETFRKPNNIFKVKPSVVLNDDEETTNIADDSFRKNTTRKPKPESNTTRLVTTEHQSITNNDFNEDVKHYISNQNKTSQTANSDNNAKLHTKIPNKNESKTEYKYADDNENTTDKSNDFKVTTMENLVKFMKVVTDTISKNTKRGVNGKVKYLNELKDNLMQNIKYRIDACWPDDNRVRRQSRAATSRGHVEFPSSESALMTISFLTFAVFLIKLVLQVIQTYKNKAMIMAPVMVATAGRAFSRKQDKH